MFQPGLTFLKEVLDAITAIAPLSHPYAILTMRLYVAGTTLTVNSLPADAVAPVYDGYADQLVAPFTAAAYLSGGKARIQGAGLTFRPTGDTTSALVGGYALIRGAVLVGWEPFAIPKVMGTVDDVIVVDAGLALDPMADFGTNPTEF